MGRKLRRKKGFTLIETLVALACASIMVSSLAMMYSTLMFTHATTTKAQNFNIEVANIRDIMQQDFNNQDITITSIEPTEINIHYGTKDVRYVFQNGFLYRAENSSQLIKISKLLRSVNFESLSDTEQYVEITLGGDSKAMPKGSFQIRNNYNDWNYERQSIQIGSEVID